MLTGANNASISKTLSYEYNLDGSLYKLHYPSGNVVTYEPDAAGLTLSAIDTGNGINYVTGATYGPDSALTGFVSGNSATFAGITNAFAYNKRLQPLDHVGQLRPARRFSPSAMTSISATARLARTTAMSSESPITKTQRATRRSPMTR